MSLNELDQALAGGGAPSAFNKDSPVGTSVTGTIVDAELRQITDYVTQKPKTWDDGRPQMQVVVTVDTAERDPEYADDDGKRRVFIKTWGVWREALNEAIKNAGGTKPTDVLTEGNTFTATFTETRPSSMGSPMKVYSYEVKPNKAGLDAAITSNTAPAATPAASAPADGGQDPASLAKQLIGIGLPDEQIANTTGLDTSVIQAIRAN